MTIETLLTLEVAVALAALAALLHVSTRSVLHPAVAFPSVWSMSLLLIMLARSLGYFQVQPAALLPMVVGALLFSAGAMLSDTLAMRPMPRGLPHDPFAAVDWPRLVLLCLVLHAVFTPLWWQEMLRVANTSDSFVAVTFNVRYRQVLGEASIGPLVGNYLVLGFIVCPLLLSAVFRGHLRWWQAAPVWLPWAFYNLVANGRAALVQVILAIFYVRLTERRRIGRGFVVGVATFFVLIFGAGVLLVAKGNTNIESERADIVSGIITNLLDYALQGPILFSAWFTGELKIPLSWDSLTFGCSLLSVFGLCRVPPLHQEFGAFASDDLQVGNVFTIYAWIFPNYGWFGVAMLLPIYGAWAAIARRRHLQGASIVNTLFAAYLFAAIPLSVFADYFAPSLNFFIKTAIVCALIERIFRRRRAAAAGADAGARRPKHPLPLDAARG